MVLTTATEGITTIEEGDKQIIVFMNVIYLFIIVLCYSNKYEPIDIWINNTVKLEIHFEWFTI